jgi:hypothetical protein
MSSEVGRFFFTKRSLRWVLGLVFLSRFFLRLIDLAPRGAELPSRVAGL